MSDGWRTVPAGSVARIEIGGTPAREEPRFWADQESGHPWASIADLTTHEVVETAEYISNLGVRMSNVKLVPEGTPIMSFKLTIGRTALAGRDLYTNEAIAAFFVDAAHVDERYLFHILPGSARGVITDVAIKGATLNKKSLAAMPLLLPPIAEQRRIAEILDFLDDQIRIGNETVSKLNLLSSGVADRLLHNGWESATPPAGWQFSTVGEVYEVQAGLTLGPHRAPRRNSTGYLRVANVQRSVINLGDVARLHASPVERARYRLAEGDLLIVEGHADVNQIGRCARVPEEADGLVYQNHLFRLRSTQMNQVVGEAWLNSRFARQYWRRTCSSSSGLNTINSKQLRAMRVLVPPPDEQGRIAAMLLGMAARVEHEQKTLDKLVLQKAGLMADLLTGRVRVAEQATS